MKTKKVLLISLLSAALVATSACNLLGTKGGGKKKKSSSASTSTSQVEPSGDKVARIKVDAKEQVVVGDTLDLDPMVHLYNGDNKEIDSKEYEVEVPAASQSLVSVDGHKVSFLKEGSVNLNIKSGDVSAKFATNCVSKIKKDLTDAVAPISSRFGFMSIEYDEDTQQEYLATGAIHDNDYTAFMSWDEDSEGNTLPGGFLKTRVSGTTYNYSLDTNWENIDVDPSPYGTFENYFVNMPLNVDPTIFETKTRQDSQGNDYDYLYVGGDVASPSYSAYFDSYIEEFCICALALGLNDAYGFDSMEIYPEYISEGVERFLFTINIAQKSTGTVVGAWYNFLIYDTDTQYYGVNAVREYIDSGKEPQSQDFTALKQKFVEIGAAKNYTVDITSSEVYMDDNFETVTETAYSYSEQVLANETQYQDVIVNTGETTPQAGEGLVEHEGSLYSYKYSDGSYPATLVGAGQKVYVEGLDSTLSRIVAETYWTNFYVSQVEATATSIAYKLSTTKSDAFLRGFLGVTYGGSVLLNNIDQYKDRVNFLGDSYATCIITTTESTVNLNLVIEVAFTDANVRWSYDATFKNIGSTAAIETEIVYPNS